MATNNIRVSSLCDAGPGNCDGAGNATNVTFRRNEITGGQDAFWINVTNGLVVEDNYIHTLTFTPGAHMHGFQTSDAGPLHPESNFIDIRGNYIDLNIWSTQPPYDCQSDCGYNSIYWMYGWYTITFENNFLMPWGGLTLRVWPNVEATTYIRNNVYASEMYDYYAADSV